MIHTPRHAHPPLLDWRALASFVLMLSGVLLVALGVMG